MSRLNQATSQATAVSGRQHCVSTFLSNKASAVSPQLSFQTAMGDVTDGLSMFSMRVSSYTEERE